jgi:UDP-glucose 4-epimerase
MRVLVVGATGFIGGHVARALSARGDEVLCLVRSRARAASDLRLRAARVLEGSVAAPPPELGSEALDGVVYAAGVWRYGDRTDPGEIERRCAEVYLDGVERIAELALEHGAHFEFLSGISRFGSAEASSPLREDSAPGRLGVFGRHKRLAEQRLAALGERGLRWTALCPPDVYGAGDPGSHVRFVIERTAQRRYLLLGDGKNRWSLCHVDNVVAAALYFLGGPGRGVVNVADARPYTQREIAEAVRRAFGRLGPPPRVPRALALALAALNQRLPRPKSFPEPFATRHVRLRTRDVLLDTARANSFGFEPAAELTDGVAETVRAWRAARRAG